MERVFHATNAVLRGVPSWVKHAVRMLRIGGSGAERQIRSGRSAERRQLEMQNSAAPCRDTATLQVVGSPALRTCFRATVSQPTCLMRVSPSPLQQRAPWLLLPWPLLGYVAYFSVIYAWTGNALEGFEAQRTYPYSPSIKNMFNVAGFTNAFLNIRTLDEMMDSALDRGFFLLFLGLLPAIWKLNKTWFWYTLPTGLVPAMTSYFMSYRRYTMVLFPLFIVLAQLLAKTGQRWIFWYCVLLLAAMQAWAVIQFVNIRWAG